MRTKKLWDKIRSVVRSDFLVGKLLRRMFRALFLEIFHMQITKPTPTSLR